MSDRHESGPGCPLHLLPDGGGVDDTKSVHGHPATDSATNSARSSLTAPPVSGIKDRVRDREGDWLLVHCCVGSRWEKGFERLFTSQNETKKLDFEYRNRGIEKLELACGFLATPSGICRLK